MSADAHLDDEQLLAVVLERGDPATREHAHDCPACSALVTGWATIRAGVMVTDAVLERPVQPAVLAGALTRIAATPRRRPLPVRRRARWGWLLLRGQVPLVRRSLAAATALMLLLGIVVLASRPLGRGGEVLSLLAPLAAALGLTLVNGPEIDPPAELTATTGTSLRLVLLARLVLVFGYDLALGLAATALTLVCTTSLGLSTLVLSWFGPMLLLSSVSFALAVLTRPAVGVTVALAAWALRLLAGAGPVVRAGLLSAGQTQAIRDAWMTSLPIVLAAVAILAVTLAAAPRWLRLPA